MRVSDLINSLQAWQAEYGDRTVGLAAPISEDAAVGVLCVSYNEALNSILITPAYSWLSPDPKD